MSIPLRRGPEALIREKAGAEISIRFISIYEDRIKILQQRINMHNFLQLTTPSPYRGGGGI
jgi:hypothetical protein